MESPMQAEPFLPIGPTEPAPEPIITPAPPPPTNSALLAQTLGVIAGIAGLTATRLLLLLAVLGAFYLSTIAANTQSNASLFVLIAYAVLIVLPLVWLDSTKRGPG
jgi:hypothetical protein